MGFFTEEVAKTSVSLYIERLSNLEEVDWYLLQQLTESIQMQGNGSREAVETIRKKLKHGDMHQKLRVLEILKLLMENTNQQFHRQFLANEKLKERFEIILTSPTESTAVKNELVSLLGTWSSKYKNEPGMKSLGDLYDIGRGRSTRSRSNTADTSGRSPTTTTLNNQTPASPRITNNNAEKEERRKSLPPTNNKNEIKTKPRSQSNAVNTSTSGGSSSGRGVFNFEKSKAKILEEIALANSNSNNLVNALKLINTAEDRWEIELQHDKKLQEYHDRCEESRKKIVRYTRLVENEEWIGTLLATNEQLLKALEMYDIMLAGEIPAVWSVNNGNSTYQEPRKTLRAPPPPPPNRLQIENTFSNMTLQKEEELDPFADPTTPIDDDRR